jgi:agmatinase
MISQVPEALGQFAYANNSNRFLAAAPLARQRFALAGVPFDGAVTNRPGARFGPQEIRRASLMLCDGLHPFFGVSPLDVLGDAGDLRLPNASPLPVLRDVIQTAAAALMAQHHCVFLGGDHSITYPIMKALGARQPLGMVHIDAHCDTGGPFDHTRFHHGGPFRLAVLDGVLDPTRCIQIGIRGSLYAMDDMDWARAQGVRIITIEECERLGPDAVVAEARRVVGMGPTYLSFDIDSLDPAFAPGTGTPEVGGLTPREAIRMLRGLEGLRILGADVVEVSPPFDVGNATALAGATMMFEILCLMARARAEAAGS